MLNKSILENIRDIIHEKGFYCIEETISFTDISENVKSVDTMISHINTFIDNGYISIIKLREFLQITQDLYIQTLEENFLDCTEELYSYIICLKNRPLLRFK